MHPSLQFRAGRAEGQKGKGGVVLLRFPRLIQSLPSLDLGSFELAATTRCTAASQLQLAWPHVSPSDRPELAQTAVPGGDLRFQYVCAGRLGGR